MGPSGLRLNQKATDLNSKLLHNTKTHPRLLVLILVQTRADLEYQCSWPNQGHNRALNLPVRCVHGNAR